MRTTRLSPVKVVAHRPEYFRRYNSDLSGSVEATSVEVTSRAPNFTNLGHGYGSRHILDKAPFNLWQESTQTFRGLARNEKAWIMKTYAAISIHEIRPHLIIATEHPPRDLPLTLGAAIVTFIPPDIEAFSILPMGSPRPYPNPARADILDRRLDLYAIPIPTTCCEVMTALSEDVSFRAIHFMPPKIIVELTRNQERRPARHSLPAKAGGMVIIYHDAEEGFFHASNELNDFITPNELVSDTSDYVNAPAATLCAGVKICSVPQPIPGTQQVDGGTKQQESFASSAGILLQNGNERTLTVASHAFPALSGEVYHPDLNGHHIGTIIARHAAMDIACVSLNPSINFNNTRYFQATAPRHLLLNEDICSGAWFELDAFTTGKVDLVAIARSYYHRTGGTSAYFKFAPLELGDHFDTFGVFHSFAPTDDGIRTGMCGAPVVDVQNGGVAGFVRYTKHEGTIVHVPAVDNLVRAGWAVV